MLRGLGVVQAEGATTSECPHPSIACTEKVTLLCMGICRQVQLVCMLPPQACTGTTSVPEASFIGLYSCPFWQRDVRRETSSTEARPMQPKCSN